MDCRVTRDWPNWLVFALLTLLVWGIDPFSRGLRFASDDLNFYYQAWQHHTEPFVRQLAQKYFADGYTRSLAFWPFVVAAQLPNPAAFLQCFYAVVWLLNGFAAARVARVLVPESPTVPFLAGCLALTATSDYHTGSVVYGPHLLGVALFFL